MADGVPEWAFGHEGDSLILHTGIKGVDFQFHFFAVAAEVRSRELQKAGKAEQRLLNTTAQLTLQLL